MKSGITKKVLAFAISLAMLTGSIPANAEETVSGSSIPMVAAESIGLETAQTPSDTEQEPSDEGQPTNPSDTTIIEDGQTPTTPAPSTDGVGSGGSSGSVSDNSEGETTVSGNEGTSSTVSGNLPENTVSDNTLSDNTLSGNTVSDNTLSGNEIEYITWSKTVDGVTITVSANKVSVPEGTDLSVEQLDPVAVEVLENAIAAEEAEQNMVVKQYKAFDITLVNDGEVVQPTEEVEVTFTGDILINEKEDGDKLIVYHLDDSDTQEVTNEETGETTEVATLNDMNGSVEGDSVVMDAPHFSKYLIALTGNEANLVTNSYVSVESNKTVNSYSESPSGNDNRYIQVRVYLNNSLVANAPSSLSNYIRFNSDTTYLNHQLTITPAANYVVSKVAYSNTTSSYNKESTPEIQKTGSTYNVSVVQKVNNGNPKYNYLDVYVSSNLTTENFKVDLFDYDTNPTNAASNSVSGTGQPLLFTPNNGNFGTSETYNSWFSGKGVYQGLVGTTLTNGMPEFTYRTADLFGPDTTWKDSYFDVDFPFTYDAGTKYYEFDSTKHRAIFDRTSKEMTVTNYLGGEFLPFGSGQFHFGMNMAVDFYMTDDGNLNGSPIIYEFSGDDDVWVFLDGKLVLDMGGIHGSIDGSINFNTGVVSVENVFESEDGYGSSYNLYTSGKGVTLEGLADGEQHELKIFYLERGAGNSNCKIKFNLPQVPQKNVLKITNTVSNNNIEEDEVDETEFIYTVKKGNEILKGVSYTFTDQLVPANSGTRTTNASDGTFALKTGQSATFSKNQDNTKIVQGTYTVTQALKSEYESAYKNFKDLTLVSDTTATPVSLGAETQLVATFAVVLDTTSSHVYKADYINDSIEAVPPVISTTKTANLRDWENRTYNISLSANAVVGSHTVTQNSDIMLVLDRSGSMDDEDAIYNLINSNGSVTGLDQNISYYVTTSSGNPNVQSYELYYSNYYDRWRVDFGDSDYQHYSSISSTYPVIYARLAVNRMSMLKSAATGFVDTTNTESPDSKIGVASFEETASLDKPLIDVSENATLLKTAINALNAGGWTRPDLGLNLAYTQLSSSASINQMKYVILFTDGEPTIGSGTSDAMKVNAVTQANNLKNAGVIIYSVFLGTNTTNRDWLANSIATSAAHAFSASNASGLEAIFDQISQEISDYENATITDYIDSRFALVKADNTTPYTDSEIGVAGITLSDGGILKVDDNGQQYITWTVPIASLTKGNTWNKNIVVKARDNFIGDNFVTTNGTGSGVTIGGVTEEFDQPVVNVKARFSAMEASDVIFEGETLGETLVNSAGVLIGDYLNTEKQHQIFNPGSVVWIDGDEEVPLAAIPSGAGFTYEWYQDDGDSSFGAEDTSLSANAIYDQTEAGKYFLKVIYMPNVATSESSSASNGNVVTGENAYAIGTYTVDVITGRITVYKTIKRSDIRFSQGDPIFTFKLVGDNGKTYYKQVRFTETKAGSLNPNDPNQYITLTTTFGGLTKGNYTLSEEYTVRYQMAEVSGVSLEAGLSSELAGNTATYQMEVPEALPADMIVDGFASFRNEKNYDKNDSDTDIVVNRFTLDSEGNLVVSADKINVE